MKRNFKNSINSKEYLKTTMMSLAILCGCCLLISFLRNLRLCFQLGKDTTDNFVWQILPEGITLIAMAICSVLIFLLLMQVRREKVFTKCNSNLIMLIGYVIEGSGIVLFLLKEFVSDVNIGSIHLVYLLLGVFFLFIACLFKLGIRMQEEQDLTV